MEQISFSKTFRFRVISMRSDRHTDNSAGIDSHFIARMCRGQGMIRTLSGEELHLKEGDVFYLPMGLRYHSYWYVDEKALPMVEWESYGFVYFPNETEKRYNMQLLSPTPEMLGFLDLVKAEMAVSPSSVGALYSFLGAALQGMEESYPDKRAATINRAADYMKNHLDCSVPEIAKACNMSESALYALFREYAHTTPVEMKHRLKIEQAKNLLLSTDFSVEEIAARLGFCSSAYLRRVMKQQLGKTPTQLRREKRLLL